MYYFVDIHSYNLEVDLPQRKLLYLEQLRKLQVLWKVQLRKGNYTLIEFTLSSGKLEENASVGNDSSVKAETLSVDLEDEYLIRWKALTIGARIGVGGYLLRRFQKFTTDMERSTLLITKELLLP